MKKSGKSLKTAAIIFMGATAAMNLLGGIGTTCAAFSNNVGYKMAFRDLLDYRWLYQGLVVTTTIVGLFGIWATVQLVRGDSKIYKNSLIILVVGTILGGVQFFASQTLRGKAVPANVKFYINLFTLILFLLFGLPGIREKINFSNKEKNMDKTTAAGFTAILAGALMLTVFFWAGPSHTFFGENWTYVFFWPLVTTGTVLISGGMVTLGWVVKEALQEPEPAKIRQISSL